MDHAVEGRTVGSDALFAHLVQPMLRSRHIPDLGTHSDERIVEDNIDVHPSTDCGCEPRLCAVQLCAFGKRSDQRSVRDEAEWKPFLLHGASPLLCFQGLATTRADLNNGVVCYLIRLHSTGCDGAAPPLCR